ncbi:thiamine ABC transporter substrate-binding protein [Actinomarinicola tropica]|uniref:Thiamine ABC transporter substrate-binding protein n=1 Tax=Actinomarinicola tropica TaxID=2789776 RepID=A0A5Q2RKL5_9ACTN|nr:thiamine ABC transporter substrate-binding protein [Actinomarinicola tropica]QGG95121.1 thiamine ABC transporter substrate-binding protein [Actinomarinicola tropica]
MSTRAPFRRRRAAVAAAALAATLVAASCGGDDSADEGPADGAAPDGPSGEVVVVAHDSFDLDDDMRAAFEEETGLTVTVQQGGDAVSVVNQAILTAGDPLGDVLFGLDDATLSRALDADLFVPHEAERLDEVDPALVLDDEHRVTPIDHGAVCVNYDAEWFASEGLEPPADLAALADPAYADMLVVQNPASSSPGLAFLTASVAEFGEDGWLDYWQGLEDNGVDVAADWSDAYYTRFSGGAGEGDRPLVVSYGSSPPAEVLGLDPLPEEAPTGVVESTCVRQIEFAGVLAGAENPEGAALLIDFLLSDRFQESIPLTYFVHPVIEGTELPEVFERFAVDPDDPYQLEPEVVADNRDRWIDEWTDAVLR